MRQIPDIQPRYRGHRTFGNSEAAITPRSNPHLVTLDVGFRDYSTGDMAAGYQFEAAVQAAALESLRPAGIGRTESSWAGSSTGVIRRSIADCHRLAPISIGAFTRPVLAVRESNLDPIQFVRVLCGFQSTVPGDQSNCGCLAARAASTLSKGKPCERLAYILARSISRALSRSVDAQMIMVGSRESSR